jgi:periplasmic protein TonB
MFETATLSGGPAGKRVWTTCVGMTGEIAFVASVLVASMVWPQALPKAQLTTWLTTPGAPLAPAPSHETAVQPREAVRRAFQFRDTQLYAYRSMPAHPVTIDEPPETGPQIGSVVGALPGGFRNGPLGGILGDVIRQAAVAPVPAPVVARADPKPVEKPVERIRLGGLVLMGRLVQRIEPVYPRIAIQMRISGDVQLEAVVGADGRVRDLQVKSGHPLLVRAAVEAVRQWVFQPTLLNGVPVEVSAPVSVTFRLGQ